MRYHCDIILKNGEVREAHIVNIAITFFRCNLFEALNFHYWINNEEESVRVYCKDWIEKLYLYINYKEEKAKFKDKLTLEQYDYIVKCINWFVENKDKKKPEAILPVFITE